jgi:hypothetical protein
MNKRIRDLKEQALCWAVETLDPDALNDNEWGVAIDEKFAELMTAEFIGLLEYEIAMLEKYKTTACNDFDRRWHVGKIEHFAKLVEKSKKHFGVEE